MTRSDDHRQYKTRIWVRIVGTDQDVEVDWAVPFASHNNALSGGGSGGDLVLVPEENTLGYVDFQGGNGAPLFYATTHYPVDMISDRLDALECKHGLITDQGLRIQETSRDIMIHAYLRLMSVTYRMAQKVGSKLRYSKLE